MKIAIIGYGRMGKEIEQAAKSMGIEVASIIDPKAAGAACKEITADCLKDVDVAIDFTTPSAVVGNIKKVAAAKKNMVIATTGWHDKVDEVEKIVLDSGIGLIYSSNFSLGVNLFLQVVEEAAKKFGKFDIYDAFGYELHHNQKLDSPSGTAKSISKIMVEHIPHKKKVVEEKLDRKIEPEELHFASVRVGWIPGTHVVGFDSEADTIELKHTARGRKGFAQGALLAAQWIRGKKGLFTMQDFMEDK
ncbi:4-hydroxy-tetrahydrodipicolinate reductase [Candidatus Woesearchaeota archaeon]|nr:4-hydroxy-tetrahydrodipicolinate reductase [Candidatus Woesearchaeota archaeon]